LFEGLMKNEDGLPAAHLQIDQGVPTKNKGSLIPMLLAGDCDNGSGQFNIRLEPFLIKAVRRHVKEKLTFGQLCSRTLVNNRFPINVDRLTRRFITRQQRDLA
jgi:hypothetical protein